MLIIFYFIKFIQIKNQQILKYTLINQKQQNSLQFNQLGFFCDIYTQSNARAVKKATRLCYVSFSEFQNALLEFPNDFEAFCKIRDNLSVYSRFNEIQCYSCNNYGHFLSECPKYFPINFRSNQIIQKYGLTEPNDRQTYCRVRPQKFNSLSKSIANRLSLYKYRQFITSMITQTASIQFQLKSQSDKKFIKQMVKFCFDPQNEQYIELPSSEDERYQEDDEEEDEFDDEEDLENEEQNKSELTLNKQEHSESNEHELKSSFRKLYGDEDSKLQTEKEIILKNLKSQNVLEELKLEQKTSNNNEDKTSEIMAMYENEKIHNHASQIIKKELEQHKGSLYKIKTQTPKQSMQQENIELKMRQNNLIYEDKNKLDDEEQIDDQISEKFFQNLSSQIQRSNSISSSKQQIQTTSNKQLIRNTSKSESQAINDRNESFNNMLSIISLSKQQSNNITQKATAEKSRGSKLGMQKLKGQNIPSLHRNSSKNLHGKQATLDYLNSIHHSINNNTDYGDKTFVSQSSIDPVQYKGSHNFSTTLLRGNFQTGISGVGQTTQEFSRNQLKSTQFISNQQEKSILKVSLKRSGTTFEEQNLGQSQRNQSKQQKDTRSQGQQMFYDEGFTSVKEFEIYFPINNQKTVMKKWRLYHLKTYIKKRKEILSPKKKRVKSKKNRSQTKKQKIKQNQQIIQKE